MTTPQNNSRQHEEYNPFAAPQVSSFDSLPAGSTDAEFVRRGHLSHEASIQSVGLLYFIGAGVLVMMGVLSLVAAVSSMQQGNPGAEFGILISIGLTALGLSQGWVGVGLRRLQTWTRIPVAIISILGLVWFPVGTVINAYILWLMLGSKGRVVLSDEYRLIIQQTPHIKYQTSCIVWGFLVLLLGIIALAVIFTLIG